MWKKALKAVMAILVLLVAVFGIGRYGWRVRGFDACQSAVIENVEVQEDRIILDGCYPGSFPEGFLGCVTKVEEDRLYVGYHFSGIFGIFETGRFHLEIPVNKEIKEVYTKTRDQEYKVWPRGTE